MSDLRSRTIRLAYTNPVVRPYLVELLATDRVAMNFPTQEALEKYLEDHPGADKSKHKVKGEGGSREHKHDSGASLGSKLKEHVRHILFDDFEDAWEESKDAFEDVVTSVKSSAKHQDIVASLKSAGTATKTFFANRAYRRKKMGELGKSIGDGAKALGKRITHAIKAEVHEVWDGVKALGQVLTPGTKPLDKHQKKALYSLGAYVAGAAITAAGGGAAMAAGAVTKSFSLHVGIKAISHLADSFFVHYEWGVEASHVVHAVSHIASDRRTAGDAERDEALVEAIVIAVSKVLEDGMTDDDVKSLLSGKDVVAYDDVEDIPAIDKLKAKGDVAASEADAQKAKEDLVQAQRDEAKSDKEASLRRQVIRLAHTRPDLRPHLLAALSD